LTGKLNYYSGAEIAGTGYVRDRDREFTERDQLSKAEVLKNFDGAIEVVLRAIRTQSESDWTKAYTATREDDAGNRFNIFLRCATHLHIMWGRWCICVLRWAEVPNRISGNRLRKNPRKQIPHR